MNIYSKQQLDFIRDFDSRLDFVEGVIRSGKTHIAIQKFILKVLALKKVDGINIMLSLTVGAFDRNVKPLLERLYPTIEFKKTQSNYYFEYKGERVYILSFSNKAQWTKALGSNAKCIMIDEVNLMDPYFFQELLGRQAAILGAKYLISTGNPDNPQLEIYKELNSCYNMNGGPTAKYCNGENKKYKWRHYHFGFAANPIMDEEMIEELTNSFQVDSIYYKTKIKGHRLKATGLVFPEIPERVFISEQIAAQKRYIKFSIGVDTSYSKKTKDKIVFMFIGITPKGELVVLDEFTHNNRDGHVMAPSDLAASLFTFASEMSRKWGHARELYIDQADVATREEVFKYLRGRGNFTPLGYKKMKIVDRVSLISNWLASDKLFIVRNDCPNLIDELANYSWSEKESNNNPEDDWNHSIDALSYAFTPIRHLIGKKR